LLQALHHRLRRLTFDQFDGLYKQIEILKPNIIIGWSKIWLFRQCDSDQFYNRLCKGQKDWNEKEFGSLHYLKTENLLILDCYHPSNTTVTKDKYVDDIVDVVKKYSV
jgi:hypothetical protein